ncbi:DNA-binding SARP family transcriptional activator [Asanoa ferruginea]|uniref:DNA-binding SARP family transcriptional activator n=2 Tax=Asanoa ferruginea TaxID=53367 RepID=A0A3D9ZRC7_9ACTN|nr:DNA-binding SARP family transcriptional activator [Asanoa ferruginea]GIF50407.1 SARP family transcriptional regulator [Asanoa ferruginea]
MDFRLLGPIEVWAAGNRVPLHGARQERVLAALLLDADRPVSIPRLVDIVWDERPPATARRQVQDVVSRLRSVLTAAGAPAGTIRAAREAYQLTLTGHRYDERTFGELAARAEDLAARSPEDAVALLVEALALWRGAPLAGLEGAGLRDAVTALNARRLAVVERRWELELQLGRHEPAAEELSSLLAAHPFRERIAILLMAALAGQGRRAEALTVYQQVRRTFAEELGVDPGPELQAAHGALLRGDRAASAEAPEASRRHSPPAHLPADVAGFTGREAELARLDTLVGSIEARASDGRDATATLVCAISGTAGVGKTALAVHWSHRVRDRFPDGQLYLDLRGFDPSGAPVTVAEAVRSLLAALGIPAQSIPTGSAAQSLLLRTELADRRVLILLDNAHDTEQVRPLLPGAAGCLVVVTSRNRLTGLVASNAALAVHLDVLTDAESRSLLAHRLGAARVAREPQIVTELIHAAARLPLALVIMAARATERARYPLAQLRSELADAGDRLDTLTGGDPLTDVRAVFSWSYRAMTPAAARMFRSLGTIPGPDIGVAAAASLVGVPPRQARALIDELVDAHLLSEHGPYRYAPHDLLRAYAAELSTAHDDPAERHLQLRRLLDHYLHSAHAALHLLFERIEPLALPEPTAGTTPGRPADPAAALAWFTAERPALLAAVRHAHTVGLDTHVWHLARTMDDFLDLRGHWDDWLTVQSLALDSARRLADPHMQAYSERRLGRCNAQINQFDEAEDHYREALRLYVRLGDQTGQASTHFSRSWMRSTQGRKRDALDEIAGALDLYRAAGHQLGEARALNALAWALAQLGDLQQALVHGAQALTLNQKLGDAYGEAAIWDTLGYTHHHLGDHREALACYRQGLDLFRHAGDRYNEADVLTHRGGTHLAAGDIDAARADWQAALEILTALGHPHAAELRVRLADVDAG